MYQVSRWVSISHVDLTWNDPLVTHTNHWSIIYEPIKRINKQELNGIGTKSISPSLSIKLLLIIAISRRSCYDEENIDNDTDHYTNYVPHSGTP